MTNGPRHYVDVRLGIVLGLCGHWWQALTVDEVMATDCPVCGRPPGIFIGSWDETWPQPARPADAIIRGPLVTTDELAAMMALAGKTASTGVIRYHCRDPRGLLYGFARSDGRTWWIQTDAAERFVEQWSPWGRLRKART